MIFYVLDVRNRTVNVVLMDFDRIDNNNDVVNIFETLVLPQLYNER